MRGRTFAAARRLSLLAALALALGWALVALATLPAHAADEVGTVAGVATNDTRNAPVAGQKVTLQLTLGSSAKDLATTTTDARGAFTFTEVDAGPVALGGRWAVYTTYQGGLYSSAPVTVKAGQTVDAPLVVYDATQDSSNLRVAIATVLIRDPDATHGLVGVAEFFTIENTGKTAFVGQTPSGAGATTAMPSLLRFALPTNAINLSTGVGFFNTQVIQIDSGFATTATVPPGQTEFAFAFQAPYTGTTLSIPFKAEYPAAQVVALVPPNMLVRDTSGLAARGIVTSFGARYQVFSATNVSHDGQVAVNLYDLPQAGERQDLNTTALLWLAAALAALLALGAGLYIWRGALGAALGQVPAAAVASPGVTPLAGAGASEAERKRLLVALLDLERRHARGGLSDEDFKRENAALRQRLRELLADAEPARAGQPAQSAPATASADGASEAAPDAEVAEPAPGSRGGAR